MADATQRHWLVGLAIRAGHSSLESVRVDPGAGPQAAWEHICRVSGLRMDELAALAAEQLHLPLADLGAAEPPARQLLPEKPARELHVLPLRGSHHTLVVATSDPLDFDLVQKLEFLSGRRVELEIAAPDALGEAILEAYAPGRDAELTVTDAVIAEGAAHVRITGEEGPGTPAGRTLKVLVLQAVRAGASELRVEPPERGGRVKLGSGGAQKTLARLPRPALAALAERVRALAGAEGAIRVEVDGSPWQLRLADPSADLAQGLRLLLIDARAAAVYFPDSDAAGTASGKAIEVHHALVVDDEADQRLLLRKTLEGAGFIVHEAVDGESALAVLEAEEHLSLMLLDLVMPGMQGIDVLKAVRSSMRTAGLPVVVVTGSTDPDDEVRLLAAGADDYIHKPIDPPAVARRVDAVLRRSDLWSFVDEEPPGLSTG